MVYVKRARRLGAFGLGEGSVRFGDAAREPAAARLAVAREPAAAAGRGACFAMNFSVSARARWSSRWVCGDFIR